MFITAERSAMKRHVIMTQMCCVFQKKLAVKFASEAEPQLFLACSFLGKFEPRCSYKIVLIKIIACREVYLMTYLDSL